MSGAGGGATHAMSGAGGGATHAMSGAGGGATHAMSGMIGKDVAGPIEADVVVLGSGAAGAAAAFAAREAGLRVALVRKAWGATAISSGAADVAPDPFASAASPLGERRSIAACVEALALRQPDHPYAALRGQLARLPAALASAARRTDGLLSFAATGAENRAILSPLGTIKTTAGGSASVLAGDLLGDGPVGIVGFDGHPAYDATLLAAAASQQRQATALPIDFLHRRDQLLMRPHEIARLIEDEPERFVASVKRALPPGLRRLLFPAVLGSADPRPILRRLEEDLGLPCAELLSLTPSLHGLRLQRRLEEKLAEAGVELWHGEACATARDPAALRVRSAAPRIPDPASFDVGAVPLPVEIPDWPVRAKAVVLATGKFLGGGVQRRERLREAVFDLPVWVSGRVDEGRWLGDLTANELTGEQPAFRAGVRIDGRLRPLAEDGSVVSARLFACGAILAGNDAARDGAGLGLAWFTGHLAGQEAAEAAGR